ncbi:nitroreductase [Anaerobacillus alkaliphilus]|uniref:Putative NAD(P)H nitroreductase n=1 Tax=Anaerobacillus alkaliphilus TaxID=1548597 RepID=A0A4Q0VNR4_9BACI|nr:nitroreductase [Anaerobacillus alkaliphilus]RXI96482.1 nitroreductase [Anaerobacillus alkaliphilus]
MDIFEAIKNRRSIGKVKQDAFPKEYIEKILEAGTYAPNHHRTEPWRFFVVEGAARDRLGEVFADIVSAQETDHTSEEFQTKLAKAKRNPLRAPVIIAVGIEPSSEKKVIKLEEYAAVNSAVQNMLLAAHALGLGSIWRTGAICYEDQVRDFFGLSENGKVLAFIYLGYPDIAPKQVQKTDFHTYTKWMNT